MENCKHKQDAHRYADGELKQGDIERFEKHLEECEVCRATLEEIGSIKNIFAERDLTDLPLGFEERLIQKAETRAVKQKRLFILPTIRINRRKWFPVAASIAILILTGVFFTSQSRFSNFFGSVDERMTSFETRQTGIESERLGLAKVKGPKYDTVYIKQDPAVRDEAISDGIVDSPSEAMVKGDAVKPTPTPEPEGMEHFADKAPKPTMDAEISALKKSLKKKRGKSESLQKEISRRDKAIASNGLSASAGGHAYSAYVGLPAEEEAEGEGAYMDFDDSGSISVGGTDVPNDEPYDATFFENYGVNPFLSTEDETFSTFGMDVDTASYAIARRFIRDGVLPDKDAIRTEEFINYFDQDYPNADGVFSIYTEGARSEFGKPNYHLLKIGIKANEVSFEDRKAANMVFVVDVSGSMNRENRLEQVKRSLRKLAEHLKEGDRIGLVVYGSTGRVISDLTSNKRKIFKAIDELRPGGSTNAEQGLRLAYEMARRNFQKGKINRIILCSDGVANVGNTGADGILKQVEADSQKGITLTTIGFGMGNYNDVLMEKLANNGDGSYYYIDSDEEANRVFGNGAVSMLQVLASDAKIQVEFDEDTVDRYRLLGYENRRLNKEDFEDDTVDAGEVGAGQTVTALYELRIKDGIQSRPYAQIATVRIRYMDNDLKRIQTNEQKVRSRDMMQEFKSAGPRFRFTAAVAEFAELLKESYWAKDGDFEGVLKVAKGAVRSIGGKKEREFIELVRAAREIKETGMKMPTDEHKRMRPERVECREVYRLSDDPMIINMADGEHYISTEIAICVDAKMVNQSEFEKRIPQIRHVVNDTLSRVSKDDLFGKAVTEERIAEMEALGLSVSEDGSDTFAKNLDSIRGTLLRNLSGNFPWIADVYFTSFLIQ